MSVWLNGYKDFDSAPQYLCRPAVVCDRAPAAVDSKKKSCSNKKSNPVAISIQKPLRQCPHCEKVIQIRICLGKAKKASLKPVTIKKPAQKRSKSSSFSKKSAPAAKKTKTQKKKKPAAKKSQKKKKQQQQQKKKKPAAKIRQQAAPKKPKSRTDTVTKIPVARRSSRKPKPVQKLNL
jgi:hypothetical protein